MASVWEVQDALRRNTLLLPGVLLLMASLCVLWHHFTLKEGDDTSMRGFLFSVLISMAPLAYVDAKIGSCTDPAGLFTKFGHKIVVLHVVFLTFRCYSRFDFTNDTYVTSINIYGLMVSVITVVGCYREAATTVSKNMDVMTIVSCAAIASFVTEVLTIGLTHFFTAVKPAGVLGPMIEAMGEYIEILSFLPAAWIILRHDKKDAAAVDGEQFKLSAMWFSGFAFAFYMVEDVITALLCFSDSKFEAFAHILHFLLLADVCGYIVGIAYNPTMKSSGTFLQRIGNACIVDTMV